MGVSASTGDLTDNHDIHSIVVRGEQGATPALVPRDVAESWRKHTAIQGCGVRVCVCVCVCALVEPGCGYAHTRVRGA